jgi:hypothetical protein
LCFVPADLGVMGYTVTRKLSVFVYVYMKHQQQKEMGKNYCSYIGDRGDLYEKNKRTISLF